MAGHDAPRVVVLHHLLGLTGGVRSLADAIADLGADVIVPDLFDGRTFDGLTEGAAFLEGLGMDVVIERASSALEELPPRSVLVGLSLGAVPSQRIAQLRGDCTGVVLVGACLPPDAFAPRWPAATAVMIHAAEGDPLFREEGDLEAAERFVATTPGTTLRLHPGRGHLLTEEGHADHDAAVTASVLSDIAVLVEAART